VDSLSRDRPNSQGVLAGRWVPQYQADPPILLTVNMAPHRAPSETLLWLGLDFTGDDLFPDLLQLRFDLIGNQ
jgi:hypothetical protein